MRFVEKQAYTSDDLGHLHVCRSLPEVGAVTVCTMERQANIRRSSEELAQQPRPSRKILDIFRAKPEDEVSANEIFARNVLFFNFFFFNML